MITLQMTQEDIDLGKKSICESCPVALCVNRYLRDGYHANAGPLWISVWFENAFRPTFKVPTPAEAIEFMGFFDHKGNAEPISFSLDIPQECLREDLRVPV